MEVTRTETFDKWLRKLKDHGGKLAIARRLANFQRGVLGDVKPVGQGVSEARIHTGPGYRLYFIAKGDVLIVVLCGGDKSSQDTDIADAIMLANQWRT